MKKRTGVYIKAVNCALSFMIVLALLIIAFVVFFRDGGANMNIGGIRLFKIISGSMEPTYRAGDYVVSRSESPENLKSGDIIAFVSENGETKGEIIVHRIVSIGDNAFVTRGDANPSDDFSTVKSEDIIGRVVVRITFLRYVDRLFSRMWVFLLLIVTPLAVIIVGEAVGVVKRAKRLHEITVMIEKYGLDSKDGKLCEIAEQYGEDAVRRIAENCSGAKTSV